MPRKDPEARREYMRKWRAKNPDKVRANDARDRSRQIAYRHEHMEQYAQYQRNRRMKFPRETLVDQAKYRAKRDGLPFDISVETLAWPTHCPVLGMELDYHCMHAGSRKIQPNSPTLDRKVNKLGYVQGNVFVISHRANRLKADATSDELAASAAYAQP